MDALVDEGGAPVERLRAAPAGGRVVLRRAVPLHARGGEEDAAEAAPGEELAEPHEVRLEAVLEEDAELHPGLRRRGHERLPARGRDVDGLLDEDVQAALGGGDALLGVHPGGTADHDQVQKITDEYIEKAEALFIEKEKDLNNYLSYNEFQLKDAIKEYKKEIMDKKFNIHEKKS